MDTRTLSGILVFLLCASGAMGASPLNINITETGKIVSYFEQYYVVSVTGTIVVDNPSQLKIFDINIPFDLGQLAIIEINDEGFLYVDKIQIPLMNPQSTRVIPYNIIGITPVDPTPQNYSIFYNAMDFENVAAKSILETQLYKGAIENDSTNRLVSAHFNNPTDYNYTVATFKVFKTTTLNPNLPVQTWDFKSLYSLSIIQPHDRVSYDVYDTNSSDGDVYWLSTDIQLAEFDIFDFGDIHTDERFTEKGLFTDPDVVVEKKIEEFVDETDIDLIVRKVVSGKVVQPGDRLNVTLIVDNLGKATKAADIKDSIPKGFLLVSKSDDAAITGDTLTWSQVLVNAQSSKYLQYVIEYIDTELLGIDYFAPVTVEYGNKTTFSPRVPFIRRYQPKQSLYIQKRLKYINEDSIEVTLTLQNLGEADLRNIVLQEFLQELDEFREITQLPDDKGQWNIPLIPQGQSWSVTYITNNHERLNSLPEVYGVDKASVSKTIVLIHTIESSFLLTTTQWIEMVGIATVVFTLLGYLYLWKFKPDFKRAPSILHHTVHAKDVSNQPEILPTMSTSADFTKQAPLRPSDKQEGLPPPK